MKFLNVANCFYCARSLSLGFSEKKGKSFYLHTWTRVSDGRGVRYEYKKVPTDISGYEFPCYNVSCGEIIMSHQDFIDLFEFLTGVRLNHVGDDFNNLIL